jgi:hypothetical protein
MLITRVLKVIGAFVILLTTGPAVCADSPSPCDIKAFGLDAGKFYLYLTKDTPYPAWQVWPDRVIIRRADSPHGPLAVIYVNPAAYESLSAGEEPKAGSLIVMENRMEDGSIRGLSVRMKIRGYNPAGNDWYWLEYDGEGKALAEGRGHECLACHGRGK